MDKKKKIIAVGILGVLICVFLLLNSYAYWQVKKKDQFVNKAASACLSITYNDLTDRIYIPEAWPTSDEDGLASRAYEFSVENTCDYDVNYQIVLESLITVAQNYMKYSDIKVQLDGGNIYKYSDLIDEKNDPEATDIRDTKLLLYSIAEAHRVNEHELRIWLASDASLDARGKEFEAKIKIFAGQKVYPPDKCFTLSNDGYVTGFAVDDQDCGKSFVLPDTINGVAVKAVNFSDTALRNFNWDNVDLSHAAHLQNIGEKSFYGYKGNKNPLIIPENVLNIGANAFYNYVGSEIIMEGTIDGAPAAISHYAFYNFNGSKLQLADNIKTIGQYAFYNYKGNDQVLTLPDKLIAVYDFAFYSFNGKDIVFNDKLANVYTQSFYNYEGIYNGEKKALILPSSMRTLNPHAFGKFNGSNLVLNDGIYNINGSAFGSYVGEGKELKIPSSVTFLGTYSPFPSFNGSILRLEEGIKATISGFPSFNGNVLIPKSVTAISNNAFKNNTKVIYFYYDYYCNVTKGAGYNGNAIVKCLKGTSNQITSCPTTCS